jgi:hypothetical protein
MGMDRELREENTVLELEDHVQGVLAPVRPPPAVKRRLRDEILEETRQRLSQDVRIEPEKPTARWVIRVAVTSAVAIAGAVLLVARGRLSGRSDGR